MLGIGFGRELGSVLGELVQWVLEAGSGGVQVLVRLGFAEGRMWVGLGSEDWVWQLLLVFFPGEVWVLVL